MSVNVGYTSIGSSYFAVNLDQPYAQRITPDGTVTISEVKFYTYKSSSGAGNIKVILYDHDEVNDRPGNIVAVSPTIININAGDPAQWYTFSFDNVVLPDGWILVVMDSPFFRFYYDDPNNLGQIWGGPAISGFYASPENPITSERGGDDTYLSLYAVAEVGGPALAGDAVIGVSSVGMLREHPQLSGSASIGITSSGDMTVQGALSGNATIGIAASGGLQTHPQLSGNAVIGITSSGELELPVLPQATGTVRIGKIVAGRMQDVGTTQWTFEDGFVDYSVNITDQFGETYRKEGRFAPEIKANSEMSMDQKDAVKDFFIRVRATDCVWDFNESNLSTYTSLIVFGLCKESKFKMASRADTLDKARVKCSIRIEGAV